jgi:spore maturation protein CgeB
VHRPVAPDPDEDCDVLFVGTGWPERQALFEAVDWTGIRLQLRGLFPGVSDASPLALFYTQGCIANAELPAAYAACRIALNPYRQDGGAESMNPRAYELAACGTFQLSDARAESMELFGDSVPTYRDAADLERLIRYYLAHPDQAADCARRARQAVEGQTFDRRVADVMQAVEPRTLVAV